MEVVQQAVALFTVVIIGPAVILFIAGLRGNLLL